MLRPASKLCLGILVAAAMVIPAFARSVPTASQASSIPLERGLTLSYVSSISGEPDYEEIIVVERADTDAIGLRISWNRGPDRRWKVFRRPVSRRERQRAHAFYNYADERDTTQYRGYALAMGTSAVLGELKREGRADVAVLVPELARRTPYRGTLTRVGDRPEPFSVILDSKRVTLPGIRAKGTLQNLSAGEHRIDAWFLFLDDPQVPWYLDSHIEVPDGREGRKILVRIASNGAESDLAEELGSHCEAHVNDIYFATGSAAVDSASLPTFQRIAQVLADHPDWQLTIVGHTDSIGADTANLTLSQRRAAAVRGVLLRDYHIPSGRLVAEGHGEQEPLEDNGTPEGRARNRRVDLKRKCN